MNMLRTVTTDWVYNPHPLLNNKQRFVGPIWVGRLIAWGEGKQFHPLFRSVIAFIFKLSGARYEIQDLTPMEIEVKRHGLEFSRAFEQLVYSGHRAGAAFTGLYHLTHTGPGPGTESTNAHA